MSEQVGSLVQRLRTMAGIGWNPIGYEAADRIEQLERSLYQLQQVNLANSELIEQLEEIVGEVIAGRYDDALLLTANLEGIDEN